MKLTKKAIALLLTLALMASCFCIMASAKTETMSGVYNGYNYNATGSISGSTISAFFYYAGSGKLLVTVTARPALGSLLSPVSRTFRSSTNTVNGSEVLDFEPRNMTCEDKIGGVTVVTFTV